MNFTVNEITNSIAGKPSLSECSIEELRQLAGQYPFFGPAQFLFVKKLKEEDSWQLKEQVRKTLLYFQNPLWLDHLLNASDKKVAGHSVIHEQGFGEQENGEVNQPAGKDAPARTTLSSFSIPILKEEFIPVTTTEMEIPATHEDVVDQTRLAKQPEISNAENPVQEQQPELKVEMPKFSLQPVDTSKTQLAFEPYHTIDYFASQGIKPVVEEKPKDQFTRQLKSFTEWLKVMKKLPVSEIAAAVSINDEKKVEKMAELSINDREVVTEAMAEVWEKQGNQAKARETYEKLSLLNPDKSSYFAAKIDQLKNS